MNNTLSSLVFYAAGIFLMVGGATQMMTKAQSESEGISEVSLIAENVRSNGYQSFGIGMACIALGSMPGRRQEACSKHDAIMTGTPQITSISDISRKRGLFEESEWCQILHLMNELGLDKNIAVADKSYMTSSNTAVVCDINKVVLLKIFRAPTGKWESM